MEETENINECNTTATKKEKKNRTLQRLGAKEEPR